MTTTRLESATYSNYNLNRITLGLAVNGLTLGKVSNVGRVELCPLLDKHRTGLVSGSRTNWTIKPFFDRDHAILIRVSDIEKVTAKTIRSSDHLKTVNRSAVTHLVSPASLKQKKQ